MRALDFNVATQKLEKDKRCDFSGIVPGTSKYLEARFNFDKEWSDLTKVAVFTERKNEAAVRIEKGKCMIPDSVLTRESFKLYVAGKNNTTGLKICTNEITIEQDGAK